MRLRNQSSGCIRGLKPLGWGLLLSALALLPGCPFRPDYSAAAEACALFHRQVDGGQYGSVYDGAATGLRSSLDRERLVGFLRRITRKMGKCDGATVGFAGYKVGSPGIFIMTRATRRYANGQLSEQFVWLMVGGKPTLFRYNADSRLLLTD
jgi:hypothetical protein